MKDGGDASALTCRHHCLHSSVNTGQRSMTPNSVLARWMLSGPVSAVMRSTMLLGQETLLCTKDSSAWSCTARAKDSRQSFSTCPLPLTLSQASSVNGGRPARRRASSPSTTQPKRLRGRLSTSLLPSSAPSSAADDCRWETVLRYWGHR